MQARVRCQCQVNAKGGPQQPLFESGFRRSDLQTFRFRTNNSCGGVTVDVTSLQIYPKRVHFASELGTAMHDGIQVLYTGI